MASSRAKRFFLYDLIGFYFRFLTLDVMAAFTFTQNRNSLESFMMVAPQIITSVTMTEVAYFIFISLRY